MITAATLWLPVMTSGLQLWLPRSHRGELQCCQQKRCWLREAKREESVEPKIPLLDSRTPHKTGINILNNISAGAGWSTLRMHYISQAGSYGCLDFYFLTAHLDTDGLLSEGGSDRTKNRMNFGSSLSWRPCLHSFFAKTFPKKSLQAGREQQQQKELLYYIRDEIVG